MTMRKDTDPPAGATFFNLIPDFFGPMGRHEQQSENRSKAIAWNGEDEYFRPPLSTRFHETKGRAFAGMSPLWPNVRD